ncbi:HPP family protein [Pseudomonas cavernae]|uniref:HPP family protein n=1 Tax=Pseudomonas cavernae TaxID=2320867 RepID=A0A385Z3D2_9PSED|nr:HPP family protein [Pseudomonas cavernae]AYC33775.1 HPP family protein [Pseudomonas cavernae]
MKDSDASLLDWLKRFRPISLNTPPREWLRAALGAFCGVLLAVLACTEVFGLEVALRVAAPLGASAVLLFGVTSSPLAQPWSIFGGNLVAALIGASAAHWIDHTLLTACAAMGLTIIVSFALRCLHPPSSAVALIMVLSGPPLSDLGLGAVLPVLLSSAVLLTVALLYNNLSRMPYPRQPVKVSQHQTADLPPSQRLGFTPGDLDHALEDFGQYLDITREDLEQLIHHTEQHALRRSMGEICAADIMSRDVQTARPDTFIQHAWQMLNEHHLKALPVLDKQRQLVGIVTLVDLLGHFQLEGNSLFQRLKYLRGTKLRAIMSQPVISVRPHTHLVELVALLSDQGLHYLPVVDDGNHLVGIVSQTDLIAALSQRWLKHLLQQRVATA